MENQRIFIDKENGIALLAVKNGRTSEPELEELIANTTDAAVEKHVPVVAVEGNRVTVKVGSVAHPMKEAHYIEWIYLRTKNGGQFKTLTPSDQPEAVFLLEGGDTPVEAYEYCNLHGLWKAEI